MPENNECSHECSSCEADCASRGAPQKEAQNPGSNVKKVIGVVSGKGGVGKSIVTSMLSVLMKRKDYSVAILDADITGPSVPKAFGANERATTTGEALLPVITKTGIRIMSLNLLLDDETKPVIWRGPIIAGTAKQFWSDVAWGEVDYMFVDMPPGTGDVPLTVYQSLPIDGIIVVTTPQDLVSMIVEKAVNMAKMMDIPIIGLVENMSYVKCPDCGREMYVFGESKSEAVADKMGVPFLGKIPIDSKLASLVDLGAIELMENDYLDNTASAVEKYFM